MTDELVDARTIMARLGIRDRATLRRRIAEGLPYRLVGAHKRFDLDEVDAWTRRHRESAA